VCKTYPGSLDQPPAIQPYDRHALDLPEILEVSGHHISDNQGVRFWPGPLADDLAREPYGSDVAYTGELHSQWDRCGQVSAPGVQPPRYADLSVLVPTGLLKWKRSLPALEGITRRDLVADGLFSNVYHATLHLARNADVARNRAGQPALTPLGPTFERAVARRVHAWLEAVRHPAVHAAWRGVKVVSRREPHREMAEFDVLLVLKNGVLWHLECKSFTAKHKDLDARLFNLQQAGSQLARMVLCGPLLVDYVNEPWFAAQHDLRVSIEARRHLAFIPFTLPGQPDRYEVEEAGVIRTFACPSLEDALTQALAVYRAASSGAEAR
jgi:hypothetical protein